jgi:predicted acylesterase/phospholipase RssA
MASFDIVFEGGGAKGSVFVGALQVLLGKGHQYRRLVGTSAGAITATLLGVGYTPEEMLAAVNEHLPDGKPRFSAFLDAPVADDFTADQLDGSETMAALEAAHLPGLASHLLLDQLIKSTTFCQIFSLVECGGAFAGDKFLQWVVEKLQAKNVAAGATFKTFFHQTGVDLSLVASDTTDMEMLVLNHRTAPDCPLAWAVRMSMSIPFVWREVIWKPEWNLYRGRKKAGNSIVDGGVLSNFPIRLIDLQPAADPEIREIMGDTDADAAQNLGLLIDVNLPVPGSPVDGKTGSFIGHSRAVQRIDRLIGTMMRAQDNAEIRTHEDEICRLPAMGYGTMEFDMAQNRLDALIDAGRNAIAAHLLSRGY